MQAPPPYKPSCVSFWALFIYINPVLLKTNTIKHIYPKSFIKSIKLSIKHYMVGVGLMGVREKGRGEEKLVDVSRRPEHTVGMQRSEMTTIRPVSPQTSHDAKGFLPAPSFPNNLSLIKKSKI